MRTSGIKRDLDANKLTLAFRGLVDAEAEYYGHGTYGAVVDNGDGTVTKLFLREDGSKDDDHCVTIYRREINALRLLSGTALSTVQVPALINDYGEVEHEKVLAAYRMTKMDGRVIPKADFDNLTQKQKDKFYHDVGILIADFHMQAETQLNKNNNQGIEPASTWEISLIPELDANRRQALAFANEEYRKCKEPAIKHGDLHLGNIMVTDTGQLSLIDFGRFGMGSDRLFDILCLGYNCIDTTTPDKYRQILASYDERRSTETDETLLLLSRLASSVDRLKWEWKNAQRRREEIQIIDEILPRLVSAGVIPQIR